MPEGPEVYILCEALKYLDLTVEPYGKHLLYKDLDGRCYDITFGLYGKIFVSKTEKGYDIQKTGCSPLTGDIKHIQSFDYVKSKLGVDWISSSKDALLKVVQEWKVKSKKIAALLLDQHEICGIGVAWGSEILNKAGIHPTELACNVDIEKLVDAMIYIKNESISIYRNISLYDPVDFANKWFRNLYLVRDMKVYKTGKEVSVSGRTFYTITGNFPALAPNA